MIEKTNCKNCAKEISRSFGILCLPCQIKEDREVATIFHNFGKRLKDAQEKEFIDKIADAVVLKLKESNYVR